MGTLYVVATPIGNLEDLSPRARRILSEVDVIAAEDTRHTGVLLKRLGINRPQVSYHAFNERSRLEGLLARLSEADVALVSNAGTPGISDPGALLVNAAASAGFSVVPIPGPSALTAAMSASGLIDGPSMFLGFLPRKKNARLAMLNTSLASGFAIVLFESPNRTVSTLDEISAMDQHRTVVMFRELTKLHEEGLRGTASEIVDQLRDKRIRGEVVIVVSGRQESAKPQVSVERLLSALIDDGMSVSDAVRQVAETAGVSKSNVYAQALAIRKAR